MNSSSWRNYYEINRRNRLEPEWNSPCLLPAQTKRELAVSLSHFQLGETGSGTFLLKEASKESSDAEDLMALDLYVKEEAEHARLLACMVQRLGGRLVQSALDASALQGRATGRRLSLRNPDAAHGRDGRHRLLRTGEGGLWRPGRRRGNRPDAPRRGRTYRLSPRPPARAVAHPTCRSSARRGRCNSKCYC